MSIDKVFPMKGVEYRVYDRTDKNPIKVARMIIADYLEDSTSGRLIWSFFRSPCIYPPFRRRIMDGIAKRGNDNLHVSRTFHPFKGFFEDGPYDLEYASIDDYCARIPANPIYLQLCGGSNDENAGILGVGIIKTKSGSEIGRYKLGLPDVLFPVISKP